ncbi:MAG: leucyl/phenylalanyl-tRNA--protein transferase [Gammaproteobacteria bacterium]
MPLPWLEPGSADPFPPLAEALTAPAGLLAAGADLGVGRLLDAYCRGIFPWYEADQPILWWSPDPRLVLWTDRLRISRSMARLIRRHPYSLTMDQAFAEVMVQCANARRGRSGTWITPQMISAYTRLQQLGHAHSVEVWQGGSLVGGLYGVVVGRMFFGESMFSTASNTSKLALFYLVQQLQRWQFPLID